MSYLPFHRMVSSSSSSSYSRRRIVRAVDGTIRCARLTTQGTAFTLQPLRRSVWHSGYMDAAASQEIGYELKRIALKLEYARKVQVSKEYIDRLQTELKLQQQRYEDLAGEAFDDTDDESLKDVLVAEIKVLSEQVQETRSMEMQETLKEKRQQYLDLFEKPQDG
jgi:hypothetical protein